MRVTGLVLVVEEPKEFSGTSKGGKPYKFIQRRFQLWTGNKAVECSDRRDNIGDFGTIPLGSKVSFPVLSIRPNGNQVSFDVKTD